MNQPRFTLRLSGKTHKVFSILRRIAAPSFARIECSWCGKLMGYKQGMTGISHGICLPCAERELAKLKEAQHDTP